MHSSSVASLRLRCQMGIMLLMVCSSVLVTISIFGSPFSSFSPVSTQSLCSTSMTIGQRT